jgi:hypothetical protein
MMVLPSRGDMEKRVSGDEQKGDCMANAWGLFKRIGKKKYGELKEAYHSGTAERIDKDLPLGLRINGMVEISQVDFILGGGELKVQHPGMSNSVLSYGTFTVGDSTVHRFYLDGPDQPYMLQIVVDTHKVVEECKLYMPYDTIHPQRSEDWAFWLDEKDGYIGLSIFQTKDGSQYARVWQNDDAENVLEEDESGNRLTRIPPVNFEERVYMDPYGSEQEIVRYDAMLYGRHVNENVDEFILLSAVEEHEGASIQLMAGIEVSPASIKVM